MADCSVIVELGSGLYATRARMRLDPLRVITAQPSFNIANGVRLAHATRRVTYATSDKTSFGMWVPHGLELARDNLRAWLAFHFSPFALAGASPMSGAMPIADPLPEPEPDHHDDND